MLLKMYKIVSDCEVGDSVYFNSAIYQGVYDVEVKGTISKVSVKTIRIKYDNNTVLADRATGRQKNTGRKKVYWKPTRF
jgi:hypothetical protein